MKRKRRAYPMNNDIECVMRLFTPQGMPISPITGSNCSGLSRDELLGGLQAAAHGRPLGLAYLLAEFTDDAPSMTALIQHLKERVGDFLVEPAMALLLRRPLPEQVSSAVAHSAAYDVARREASVLAERAKRAHRRGCLEEYTQLKQERATAIHAATEQCRQDMMRTGRCPACHGTGTRPRSGLVCPACHGIGRISADVPAIRRVYGDRAAKQVSAAVDAIIAESTAVASAVAAQYKGMRV
ncbi:TIGR02642 family protein [Aeromonas enteropelogenes]|uniref:TIGR02642 family protein n=2 Tax=Aeromonas enteropelogenes TaxID=29489 RepID=UPI003B9E7F81